MAAENRGGALMPESFGNGLIGIPTGCSPKLAERLAPSALGYRTARLGSANCVEPGPLFEVRTFWHENVWHSNPAANFAGFCLPLRHSLHIRQTHAPRADVLSRSGPEITL
jgi:hypothetical protein